MRIGRAGHPALLGVAMLCAGAITVFAAPAAYHLGPQDRLQVKVYDWRTGTGEAHEWPALTGEFVVGASGALSLPLIGEVSAFDKTTTEVSDIIARRLQDKIGLAQEPDASVQVVRYRPFYIMGEVDKPGEYDFRPDLTVLQAVSTAGGLPRLSDSSVLGFERDALVTRGDLRAMDVERIGLLARQARVDAEASGGDAVAFPSDLTSRAGDPLASRALREEQLLFDAHASSDKTERDALLQLKDLLDRQVSAFAAKDASLAHQLDVTRKELSQISGLVAKGFAVLPRQLEAEQNTAQLESSRLDVQLATLRAQQDLAKASTDLGEVANRRRSLALTESADVRAKLADLGEKILTAQRLIYQAEVRAPSAIADSAEPRAPTYTVTRTIDGWTATRPAQENDPVQPGDIVRVAVERAAETRGASRARSAESPPALAGPTPASSTF